MRERVLRVLAAGILASAVVGALSACDRRDDPCLIQNPSPREQTDCLYQQNHPYWNGGYPSYGYGTYG